jgi:hypothetical protein
MVSPNHASHFDGVLIPPRLLADGVPVRHEPCSTVEYCHPELASHHIMFAEGPFFVRKLSRLRRPR